MINLSFIVVNYNGLRWLDKFFESFKSQTDKNYEIIFVDNNSSDDSVKYVKSLKDNRINIVPLKENKGFATGNNIGISNAKYNHLCLINNDVWFEKSFIEKLKTFYVNNNYDVIAPNEANYDKSSKHNRNYTIDMLGHCVWIDNPKDNINSFYLQGICLMFNKNLYYETGGLDNDFFMYFEETDWFWRLNLLKKTYTYVPNLYIYHKGSGSTGSGIKANSFLWRNQNTLQMLLKNYGIVMLIILLPLYFLQNLFEIFGLIILGKTKIAKTYIYGYIFNFKYLKRTIIKRRIIQKSRLVNDFQIIKKMYKYPGKLKHLYEFYKNNKSL